MLCRAACTTAPLGRWLHKACVLVTQGKCGARADVRAGSGYALLSLRTPANRLQHTCLCCPAQQSSLSLAQAWLCHSVPAEHSCVMWASQWLGHSFVLHSSSAAPPDPALLPVCPCQWGRMMVLISPRSTLGHARLSHLQRTTCGLQSCFCPLACQPGGRCLPHRL